ncbi:MAG: TrmH family RNA methyltransferase [Bacteroidetes bacterium]|nr:MAG: TrmH family RNA methyltransferase [Bacteroidota bacterium]
MEHSIKSELLNFLESFISENKRGLFKKTIEYRTRYITVVLEDIFQPHNASAVLRTCDCFGVQDVHIIENRNLYEVNPDVALGSAKWLTLKKYNEGKNNTLDTIGKLKSEGYTIVATTPHENDTTLDQLDLSKKTALLFGTELNGLSDIALENADEFVKIPMYGFTESFNISVSAAIILHQLTEKLRGSEYSWQLTEEEKLDIRLDWVRNVVKKSDLAEEEFFARKRNRNK